jgi:hypothetical protein
MNTTLADPEAEGKSTVSVANTDDATIVPVGNAESQTQRVAVRKAVGAAKVGLASLAKTVVASASLLAKTVLASASLPAKTVVTSASLLAKTVLAVASLLAKTVVAEARAELALRIGFAAVKPETTERTRAIRVRACMS